MCEPADTLRAPLTAAELARMQPEQQPGAYAVLLNTHNSETAVQCTRLSLDVLKRHSQMVSRFAKQPEGPVLDRTQLTSNDPGRSN